MPSDPAVREVSVAPVASLLDLPLPWELVFELEAEASRHAPAPEQSDLFGTSAPPTVPREGSPTLRWYATSSRERHAARRRVALPCVSHKELATIALGAERGLLPPSRLRSLLLAQPKKITSAHFLGDPPTGAVSTYPLALALAGAHTSIVSAKVYPA